ncbi:hydrogen peroxide-inducible genes activator [Nocardiopsis terrae]|nr:LysR family transcriptional regulator [Nocardiopsis terrae]GHC84133.1 hydrogen peroxide-inducible genes activator [Nocardiopsis terrae]
MDVKLLETFIAVAEIKSFTRAATRLRVSQPTVTARVKILEQILGAPLVERLTTGTTLTSTGADLLPRAREIVELSHQILTSIGDKDAPSGHLRVGTVDSLLNYRLFSLIEYIYLRFEKMEVSMKSARGRESLEDVRDGRLDCAFIVDFTEKWPGLESRILCPEPLALVCSPKHPLAHCSQVTESDLFDVDFLLVDSREQYQLEFKRLIGAQSTRRQSRVFELYAVDAVKRGVYNGMGAALLPEVTVRDEIEDKVFHRVDWTPDFKVFAQVVWRLGASENHMVRALVDNAAQAIAEQHTESFWDG